MSKSLKKYGLIWLILFVMFNVIVFVTPSEIGGLSKFGGAFWPSYVFITVAFLGQLFCGYKFFSDENNDRMFLNLPLMTLSYSSLWIMIISGSLCMAIPGLPAWAGAVICVLVLGFSAVSLVKSQMAADMITDTGNKIKTETAFMRSIIADAENLISGAAGDNAKSSAKKVYEALRYSDPVSSSALLSIEREISEKFSDFSKEIKSGNDGISLADEIIQLINERNNKCKALK